MEEIKDEQSTVEVYKEGMVVAPRPDGRPPEPPEGFTIYTTEKGIMLLRRRRQRNLHKLGKKNVFYLFFLFFMNYLSLY